MELLGSMYLAQFNQNAANGSFANVIITNKPDGSEKGLQFIFCYVLCPCVW